MKQDTIIAYFPPVAIGEDDIPTLPHYKEIAISSNKVVKEVSIFKESIKNNSKIVPAYRFFRSNDYLKPDKTKIVQAMAYLSQINIIDLKSEEIKGYRKKETPDFSIFETDMERAKCYYVRVQADDLYIYTLYIGEEVTSLDGVYASDNIHIFDWSGNLIKKLKLEKSINEFWLDSENNLLYGYNGNIEELYCYNLEKLMIK